MGVVSCGTTMLDQGVFNNIGAVTWDTTAKTASFTAVSGNGYFVNTTSGAITVTLPATPSAGDIIAVKDYANTFDTNNVTLARNGSNIGGEATDSVLSTEGLAVTLVYVDSTKGWLVTDSGLQNDAPTPSYITATGGTITCCGDYKIHTFTGPGTFTVSSVGNPLGSDSVDYLVVAGGGGGFGSCGANSGGGGGAGGFRESSGAASGCYTASPLGSCVSALPVTAQGYPIAVGGGGAGSINNGAPSGGSSSAALSITSTGGGAGGPSQPQGPGNGNPGGSGSGAGGGAPGSRTGGSGNTPPVNPPQGSDGGDRGPLAPDHQSAGGGGATAVGGNGLSSFPSGGGGTGATTSISGSALAYAGGGGGAGFSPVFPCSPGLVNNGSSCGTGGSGAVTPGGSATAESGTTNRGGGGGSASSDGGGSNQAGSGGSGVVIIRYKFQ